MSFDELVDAVRKNRKYSPWAKTQDIHTYIEKLVGEVQEVKEAVDNNELENLKEELGDVLWDTLTMLIICEEQHGFGIDDSIKNVIEKLKRRKPHVFENKTIPSDE
jgi:NTP pyrophosphatase (non-canonical NTP hydrolase)